MTRISVIFGVSGTFRAYFEHISGTFWPHSGHTSRKFRLYFKQLYTRYIKRLADCLARDARLSRHQWTLTEYGSARNIHRNHSQIQSNLLTSNQIKTTSSANQPSRRQFVLVRKMTTLAHYQSLRLLSRIAARKLPAPLLLASWARSHAALNYILR